MMSRFDEIREQFATLRDAEEAYWQRLEGIKSAFRNGFAEYLGVDPDEKVGASGEPRLWFGAKRSFSGKQESVVEREHNELIFTLNLVLDKADRSFPPNTLSFRLRLKYVAERYMILEDGVDRNYTTVVDDFTPFYEHLYHACRDRLAKFTRLI